MIHLCEQRLSVLPSPIVQGLSTQLVVQDILHLDISGSHHKFASEDVTRRHAQFQIQTTAGRLELIHLREQRLTVLHLPDQLVSQHGSTQP